MASEDDDNMQSFCLVWLDDNIKNSKVNIDAHEHLRKCFNNLKRFKDKNDFELYIQSMNNDKRILWIVNNHLGEIMIPLFHSLQQIFSIYIYDLNKKTKQEWIKHFLKVKGIFSRVDILIEQIRLDLKRQDPNKIGESLVFNVFNVNSLSEQSTTGLNGQFVQSQLLINCLLRMKEKSTDKDELISLSEKEYKDNENELSIIQEFKVNYSSDRSLWWYTRESFLYRQLNKALRMQNIDLLFIFRFFIRDMKKQLEQHQCSSVIRIFRGQLMSNEELQLLKDSIGQLISMNSFLSTSLDRRLALSFLYSSNVSDKMQRVLFDIDADPRLEGIKPFANITSLSYFPGEDEILLMLGSIFRLLSIDQDNRGIWIFRLTLCNNTDPDLQSVFNYMKDQYGNGETTLLSVGMILSQMGKYDQAEKYYRRLLNEMSPDHEDLGACYHNLGNLFDEKADYQSSIDWHNKALNTMIRSSKPDNVAIGTSYNSIAAVHAKMGNYDQALESFLKAFNIWKQVLGEDHPNIGQCLSNIAGIYQMYNKYSEALEYLERALIIYQKHLPTNHPQMGDLHNNIGIGHWLLEHLDLAFKHLNMSLQIKQKCLPSEHPDIAMTLCNMGLVYEDKGDWQQAILYLQKAADIYRHVLFSNHPTLIKVEQLIERVSSKSKMT